MQIKLTKEMIEEHAELIKLLSAHTDEKTGGEISLSLSSCLDLLSKIYGFKDYNQISSLLKNEET